jgi:dTDP-4-dehydrorhamnose reductase
MSASNKLQVWGGVECTYNRVSDQYFDQLEMSGHAGRLQDYDEFAKLGLTALRIALLWERHRYDPTWTTFDQHLQAMSRLGIEPIAGLMHHGSGPKHTSLLDPDFPEELSFYARELAQRYPHICMYTPVNEPHTTARFSGMYGLWYPHHTSASSYLRALIHQVKATVLCMESIREIQPDARLVFTDDFGWISSTSELRADCERMNLEKWLALDLLCGKVNDLHPLFAYMVDAGLSPEEIAWFVEHRCPPGVIGINYYPTSDRFLDHRTHLYPSNRMSAEGPFVDVEAVRVHGCELRGFGTLIQEAWQRYRIPVAITEVHLGGNADQQIRWADDAYQNILAARDQGAECIAMTFWALLGSFYWNQLVTRDNGHYEPGVFDIRSGIPVATELAKVVEQIAQGRSPNHPALSSQGWWEAEERFCFSGPHNVAA